MLEKIIDQVRNNLIIELETQQLKIKYLGQ